MAKPTGEQLCLFASASGGNGVSSAATPCYEEHSSYCEDPVVLDPVHSPDPAKPKPAKPKPAKLPCNLELGGEPGKYTAEEQSRIPVTGWQKRPKHT